MSETTIFKDAPKAEALYEHVRDFIVGLGDDVRVEPKKTQISFKSTTNFAYVWRAQTWGIKRPEDSIILSFDVGRRIDDSRIAESAEARKGRWIHHIVMEKKSDLDATVKRWLREAHEFGQVHRRGKRTESARSKA